MDRANQRLQELRAAARPTLVLDPEPSGEPASVALLPGSFDPVTVGHAAMADAAKARGHLVLLVYSVRTLPKDDAAPLPLLSEVDRIASVERFCAARGHLLGLCSHGLLAEQVDAADERFPSAELSLVIGSDKLLQLFDPVWYEDRDAVLATMFERANVLFATRAGDGAAVAEALARRENRRWAERVVPLDVSPDVAAVSSRVVRDRLRRGEDVSEHVPEEIVSVLPAAAQP